jgi:hypothetical protein
MLKGEGSLVPSVRLDDANTIVHSVVDDEELMNWYCRRGEKGGTGFAHD